MFSSLQFCGVATTSEILLNALSNTSVLSIITNTVTYGSKFHIYRKTFAFKFIYKDVTAKKLEINSIIYNRYNYNE